MRFTKVCYSQLFALGSYLNERIGVEVEINEGDDPMLALEAAKQLSVEFNKVSNPVPTTEEIIQLQQEKEEKVEKERLFEMLKDCKTRDELRQYQLLAMQMGLKDEYETFYEIIEHKA